VLPRFPTPPAGSIFTKHRHRRHMRCSDTIRCSAAATSYGSPPAARAPSYACFAPRAIAWKLPTPGSRGGVDFLAQRCAPEGVTAIITNPPYRLADKFVRHALALASRVAMLLPLRYLEGVRRSDILDAGTLAQVFVFRNRLPMMHRAGWQGPRASSQMAFAWFVWERDHRRPAELHRISWDESTAIDAPAGPVPRQPSTSARTGDGEPPPLDHRETVRPGIPNFMVRSRAGLAR
jgi:hypothetical protein